MVYGIGLATLSGMIIIYYNYNHYWDIIGMINNCIGMIIVGMIINVLGMMIIL